MHYLISLFFLNNYYKKIVAIEVKVSLLSFEIDKNQKRGLNFMDFKFSKLNLFHQLSKNLTRGAVNFHTNEINS